ncbi:unnamed protein product [Schistosoma rodhaini]|uniref:Ubiquitin-like domain-containing protein n=2 Tax=Schistosoma rodhaini TaxID=6188 RepID=A0AA85G7Z2_9TREM|nr:unnamed protein product [Schistosoma rodhaini]
MYIFLMDQGRLVSLDDNLLSQTVSSLRNVLAHDFDLPLNKQILLVSGGFQLEPGDKLSTYGAGLDKTNPIYVFTQTFSNDTTVQKPDVLQVNDGGYPRQLACLLELAPSEKVFEERLRLIRSLTPIGREAANAIEQLVSEQRQMIQGWCVALANLAEVAADTNKRLLFATSRLVQFEGCVSDWERKLYNFNELKKELSELPLPPQLVAGTSEIVDQKESFNFNNIPKPTNLYEWVCLQSAISSIGTRYSLPPSTIKAVGLQSIALYLGRHAGVGSGSTGRVRTTSTGHIGVLSPANDGIMSNNSGSTCTGSNQPTGVSFYTGGSQTSLNSLCSTNSNSSDMRFIMDHHQYYTTKDGNDTIVQDHSSSASDCYESAFLDIIKRALHDIHSLRFGPDSSFNFNAKLPDSFSNELVYVRAQTNRLSELITMVTTCSKSNYDEMTTSTMPHPSTKSSSNTTTTNPVAEMNTVMSSSKDISINSTDNSNGAVNKKQIPPFTSSSTLFPSKLPYNDGVDDIHLVSVRDALDPGYFSQRLSQLDPLLCEAVGLARNMIGIEQNSTKAYQQIIQQKVNSLLQTKFIENTQNAKELIIAFNRLCEILGIVMESKLLLANNLFDRQRWLQNFQSELNRLDAIIQRCLRRMCRVTTTGTLISQLNEAGPTYARCLAEIVRRTEFDDMLTQRSVCYLKEETNLRTEECRRRRIFSKHLKNNVLHSLFSPWTNPKAESLGLSNIPGTISMSQDVAEQQLCETSTTTTTTTTTTTITTTSNQKVDSLSHSPHTNTTEFTVNRRFALSSLSEPRLNELAKACALNRVQHSRVRSTRLNSLSSPDPHLTKVKEDEMIESDQNKKRSNYNCPIQHQPVLLRPQHTKLSFDANRRASMPFDESDRGELSSLSNWSVDSSSLLGILSNNFYQTHHHNLSTITQSVKITRDDLERLMQSMPTNISNLLRIELNKSFSLFKNTSFLPNSSLINPSGCVSLDQTSNIANSTGFINSDGSSPLSNLKSTIMTTTTTSKTSISTMMTSTQINMPETKSITTSPFSSLENVSTRDFMNVGCQAEFGLIGPILNVGSGRSLNSSLGLSVDDSVRRTTIHTVSNIHTGWEELPGSLCSWDLCRFPPVAVRSGDRMSISLNTLPRFEHLMTTGTQTEEQLEFSESHNTSYSPVKPMTTEELCLQNSEAHRKNSTTHENNDNVVDYHLQTIQTPITTTTTSTIVNQHSSSSSLPFTIHNDETNEDNIIISSIFTEDNLFTDSALMMTSSFHSTKTTFSNSINSSNDNTTNDNNSNNNNNNTSSLQMHTPFISMHNQSRSMSSSNLCDLTNATDICGSESTTTQYDSMIYDDDVKTSRDVLLLPSSSSLPEVKLHELIEKQNQITSFTLLDHNCFKCRLKRIHQEYIQLLQESLKLINNSNDNDHCHGDVDHYQLKRNTSETVIDDDNDNKSSRITTNEIKQSKSPISLDAIQLKCLFNVLESCSLLFLKSKHISCESSHPVCMELNTTTSNSNDTCLNIPQPDLSTILRQETIESLIDNDSAAKECVNCVQPSDNTTNDTAVSDQLDFGQSLQYLMETLQLNSNISVNPVTTVSISTSTSPLSSQILPIITSSGSILTQTEVIPTLDMATSITTPNNMFTKGSDFEGRTSPICEVSTNLTSSLMSTTTTTTTTTNNNNNNNNNPLSTISRSTSPILQQQNHNNEQTCNLSLGSSCFTNISSKSTNERFTNFVHSNFLPDDIVIFVPVPGTRPSISSSTLNTSPTTVTSVTTTTNSTASCILSQNYHDVKADGGTTAAATTTNSSSNNNTNVHDSTTITKSDIWSMNSKIASNLLGAISPSSSLLSSMIVQSSLPFCSSIFMDSSSGGGIVAGSSGTGTTNTTTSISDNNTLMNSSSILSTQKNICAVINSSSIHSNSTLANELCTSTFGGNYGTLLTSTTPPTTTSDCSSTSVKTTTTTETSFTTSTSTITYVQWRMLSSDGHVYFLHQDDFKALNIDDHIDYCKPMSSNVQETNSSHHRNVSFKEAFPAHNYFIAARYKSKERCLSKRANNRFNLPRNFIFYRVRARPLLNSDSSNNCVGFGGIPSSPSPTRNLNRQHQNNGSIKNSVICESSPFVLSDTDVNKE